MQTFIERHPELDRLRCYLVFGQPRQVIHELVQVQSCNLIITGWHGLAFLLGSTSNDLLHVTACDMLAAHCRKANTLLFTKQAIDLVTRKLMNIKILLKTTAVLLFLIKSMHAFAIETTIESNKSVFHVGERLMVCGEIKETKIFSKGLYINLGDKYPRQHITILVWESDLGILKKKFGEFDRLVSRKSCTYGEISEYNKTLQIKLENPNFFRILN